MGWFKWLLQVTFGAMVDLIAIFVVTFPARGKKKKLKMLLPFLLMLKLKAAALIPLALGGLALLALKALIVGKLALVLSALIGLQKLLGSKHHSQSYEVVAHPHYSEEHAHYGRSLNNDLPYAAHAPVKQE